MPVDWGKLIDETDSQTAGANASAPAASPDEAARTLRNATKAGVPYSAGSHDPQQFNEMIEGAERSDLARNDPTLRNYFSTYDWAGPISQGDLPGLAQVGGVLKQLGTDVYDVTGDTIKQVIGAASVTDFKPLSEEALEASDTFKYLVGRGISPEQAKVEARQVEDFLQRRKSFQDVLFAPGSTLLAPLLGAFRTFVSRPVEETTGFPKEATEGYAALALLAAPGFKAVRDAWVYRSANESPKPGVDYNLDRANIEQSKADNENLQQIEQVLDATKTKQISPEATKAFIESAVGDKRISIPANAIDSVLGDKATEAFNWQPDFLEQLAMAREGGGDVSVKLSDWNAFATPELKEALKDYKRVRPSGLTPNEREALEKTTPEQYPPDELHVNQEQLKAESERLKTEIAGLKVELEAPEPTGIAEVDRAAAEAREAERKIRAEQLAELQARKSLVDRWIIKPKGAARQVAERELWLNPLFDADTFKRYMTASEFRDYSKILENEATDANAKELARQHKEIAKRQSTEWKTNREREREKVQSDFDERSVIMADRFLRTKKYFGEKVANFESMDRSQIPVRYNQLFERYTAKKGGWHPDDIASLFGYDSGRAMLEDLLSLDQRRGETQPETYIRGLVDAETDRQMEAKYGVLQDNILAEEREAVGTGGQADLLVEEWVRLGNALGELPSKFNREWFVNRATDLFSATKASEARSVETFTRDVGLANRRAETALRKANLQAEGSEEAKSYVREAFQAKQQGAIAFQFYRQAQKFARQVEWTENVINRYGKNQIIESVDQRYTDQIHAILESMGLGKSFPLPKGTPSLSNFIRNSDGKVEVAYWLHELGDKPEYKDLTVNQYRAFSDSLRSLIEAGRDEKKIIVAEGKADLDEAAVEIKDKLSRFPTIPQDWNNPTLKMRSGRAWRGLQAKLLLVERVLDYSDANDPNGPLTRYIDNPLRLASSKEIKLSEQVRAHLKEMEKYTDRSVNEEIQNDLVPSAFSPTGFGRLNRGNLRMIALYMGDEARAAKFVKGIGLVDPTLEEFYGSNSREVLNAAFEKVENFLRKNMTAQDWRWVQAHWKLFDVLKPEADAVHIRDTGVPVDETPRRSMETEIPEIGRVEGGYTPLVYDRLNTKKVPKGDPDALFQPTYNWASTQKGYTKALTEYAEPLDLTGALMPSKIMGMIHDIAFREAIRSVDKVIRHPDVKESVTATWGKEIYDMFPRWIRDLANVQNVDDSFAQGAAYWSAFARQNLVSGLIFLAPRTVLKHGLTATSLSATQGGWSPLVRASSELWAKDFRNSVKAIRGARDVAPPSPEYVEALKDLTVDPERGQTNMEFILENSPLMRQRLRKGQDNIRDAYIQASKAGILTDFLKFRSISMDIGRTPVAWSDALTAFPTWWMNYKRAAREGFSPEEAFLQADKAVTRAHGSQLLMDKPEVLRTSEVYRWFTPLYNFWNHAGNLNITLGWDIGARLKGLPEPGANWPSIINKAFKVAVWPLMVEEFANLSFSDKHESLGTMAFKAIARFFGSMIPGVNSITNYWAGGREISVGLWGTFAKTIMQAHEDAAKIIEGKKPSRDVWKHAFLGLALISGIGGAALGLPPTMLRETKSPVYLDEYMRFIFTGHTQPPKKHR